MGKIIISERTVKDPITLIGEMAGVCYGAPTHDPEKNYKRGIHNLKSGHGRTWEFPDVYLVLDGYSARVVREWYTHIGGAPTRLQSSTRYIDYVKGGFKYITPHSIENNARAKEIWDDLMDSINITLAFLEQECGIPHEDTANGLPLGMETTVVCRVNLRTLIDMSHQRMCTCAYWEYRELFRDLCKALSEYSDEWKKLVDEYFMPKCKYLGYCNEGKRTCGLMPLKEI
jgi:thymidylate synthase (FAD)